MLMPYIGPFLFNRPLTINSSKPTDTSARKIAEAVLKDADASHWGFSWHKLTCFIANAIAVKLAHFPSSWHECRHAGTLTVKLI